MDDKKHIPLSYNIPNFKMPIKLTRKIVDVLFYEYEK